MPGKVGRPRKYHTEEEQRMADCKKSQRYYTKKKTDIARRRARQKKLTKQGKNATKRSTETTHTAIQESSASSSTNLVHKPPSQKDILRTELVKIEERVSRVTENQTDLHWLSGLCTRYAEAQDMDVVGASLIFERPSRQLLKIQTDLNGWKDNVLNFDGVGKLYREGNGVDTRLRTLLAELAELDGLAILGPGDLAASFKKFELDFQTRLR